MVLRNKTTVAYYYWPRIAKVYFKGRYFMLRVCDKNVRVLNFFLFSIYNYFVYDQLLSACTEIFNKQTYVLSIFTNVYFMFLQNEVSTYGFETPRKSACRHLWRCCVEHHAFFRLIRVAPLQSQEGPGELFSLGSRFRYR